MKVSLELDPLQHDAIYDPHRRIACPTCKLPVGIRFGKLNDHVVSGPVGHVEPDGVLLSVLDGGEWCRGSQTCPWPRAS